MQRKITSLILLLCTLCGMAGTLDKYIITPESGTLVTADDLKQVKITFPDAKEIASLKYVSVVVYNVNDQEYALKYIDLDEEKNMTIEKNYVILDISEVANLKETNLLFKISSSNFYDSETYDYNTNMSWTYTLPEKPNSFNNKVVTPSVDETVTPENMQEVTITFPDVKNISFAGLFDSTLEVWYNGNKARGLYPGDNAKIDGNKVTISISKYWIEEIPGKLELKFGDRYFKDEDSGNESKAFTLAWNIDKKHIAYTVTPAPGSTVSEEDLENFVITFTGAERVEVDNWYDIRLMYRGSSSTSSGGWDPKERPCTIEGNKVTIPIWQGDPKGGDFTLNIHEGLFIVDGTELPETNIDYTLMPIDTHFDLKWNSKVYHDGKLHAIVPEWGKCQMSMMPVVYLKNENGSDAGYVEVQNSDDDEAYFTFYTYEGTEKADIKPGKYYFTCPEGAITIKRRHILYDNRAVEIHFEKLDGDGIADIIADSDDAVTYSINGMRAGDSTKGIVIKNNRKVLMNK